ncbi:type 1 glutamine amidotransferase domain-containing protein [Dawidia soli]|uniref:Type 1 glutamine amidotransferase n=1 Tax=Dawidia soli TaxID=2782352 RepID=A0AAP2GGA6_9BACT|nr:type 1 glutamine amidotransferase domain-containing protein [Dawidia soli]MBT1690349.1 type 1 glutamine amidotransferase [Dawidia soli]
MSQSLKNKRVAVVATHGVEESEFTEPVNALKNAGATVEVISLKKGSIKAWAEKDWGKEYPVDKSIDEVNAGDYDALVLPGGVMNPDHLRVNKKVVDFATEFLDEHKPVAAICHGPWTLIETGLLEGRKMTSYPSIKTDLINAGVDWVDQEVVVDNGLVTSRNPNDLPAFCRKMVEEIGEGVHA